MASTAELQAQLDSVNATIAAIHATGQSYRTPEGLLVQRPSLDVLLAERRRLEQELVGGGGGAVRIPVRFRGMA